MIRSPSRKSEITATRKSKKIAEDGIRFVTKRIESSIAILDSTEDKVVMEALVFIIQYVDISKNNLEYAEQCGLLQKILNLFNRNKCIRRLVLKLLGMLLTLDQVLFEIDQDIYDEKILEICETITSKDPYIRMYCTLVLSKLTESCRITYNILNFELFDPIMDAIKSTTNTDMLQWTLQLLLRLIEGPTASEIDEKISNLDTNLIMKHFNSNEGKVVDLALKVIEQITSLSFDVCQAKFKDAHLVEKLLSIIMNERKREYRTTAFSIINNCLNNEETSDYFIETLEFLQFCQWVKTCMEEYLFSCLLIIEHLTRIPDRRQTLFDLSVEEVILSCLRSTQKKVLNKTCEAICNMMKHKYCCKQMLTPYLIKELFLMLARKDDEEDPHNEVALKTIVEFSRSNLGTLDIIRNLGVFGDLMNLFHDNYNFSSEDSFQGILEILHKISLQPQYRDEIINQAFFGRLLEVFEQSSATTAGYICHTLTSFLNNYIFRHKFAESDGPKIFMETLQNCKDIKFLKIILLFIYNSLSHNDITLSFLQKNLVDVLKQFPEALKIQIPLIDKILQLIYNNFSCLKFFETGRLEVTDKFKDRFYLIHGLWQGPFPHLEDLAEAQLSTLYTVYVVDYTEEVTIVEENSIASDSVVPGKVSPDRTLSTLSRVSSNSSSDFRRFLHEIHYGRLTPDPFLPKYIFHFAKHISQVGTIEEKVKALGQYVNVILGVPQEGYAKVDKIHNIMLHVEIMKHKLGTNVIPIGFLKLGTHCERALLFKAIADKTCIPTTLVKGKHGLYWNEVALISCTSQENAFTLYVVDLMKNVGELLLVGSRAANQYCNLKK